MNMLNESCDLYDHAIQVIKDGLLDLSASPVNSLQSRGPGASGSRIATSNLDDVFLVSDNVGENDVLDLGGVDAELLVDFDEEVEGERLVVEGRSSSAHKRSRERSDVLLGSGEEVLLAVGDVVAKGSLVLVGFPEGLEVWVKLVGSFKGEKDVVSGVVRSSVGSFWELGAEKVGVFLALFFDELVGDVSLLHVGLGDFDFFLSLVSSDDCELIVSILAVVDTKGKSAVSEDSVPGLNCGHSSGGKIE